jgi:integrase
MTPKLIRQKNAMFYAVWSEDGRSKRRSLRTSDREIAEVRFADWLRDRRAPAAQSSPVTAADAWAAYVTTKNASAAGRHAWGNLSRAFGEKRVDRTRPADALAYLRAREAGRIGRPAVASTVRKELAWLQAVLNNAAALGLVPASAVPRFPLPPAAAPRSRWLTRDEINRLLAEASALRPGGRLTRLERFARIALETGARKTAVLELTWDRVDLGAGVIHFAVEGEAYSKKRRASVPISAALRPVLEQAQREATGPLVMDTPSDIWRQFTRCAARAGLADVTPHTLRHTAATHMARGGVPLWQIAKILGNTLAVVEATYAKWAPDDAAGTVDHISRGNQQNVA